MIQELELAAAYRFWKIFLLCGFFLLLHDVFFTSVVFVRDVPFLFLCVAALFVSGFELLLLLFFTVAFLCSGAVFGVSSLACFVFPLSLFFLRRFFLLQPWVLKTTEIFLMVFGFLFLVNGFGVFFDYPWMFVGYVLADGVLCFLIFLVWYSAYGIEESI